MKETWENGRYTFKDGFEEASPEIREYYKKMVSMFAQAAMEIGYKNALSLVKEILASNLEMHRKNVDVAKTTYDNTIIAIKELERAS